MNPSEEQSKEDLKGLYDLAIPLGMPVSVIHELVETYELELVKRRAKVDVIGEVDEREILVLRGDLESVKMAEKHMFKALDRKLAEWDRNERYKNIYKPPKPGEKKRTEDEWKQDF